MSSLLFGLNRDVVNSMMLKDFLLLVGVLNMVDCFLTVVGVSFFGLFEANPFFRGMTGVSVLVFIFVKFVVSSYFLWLASKCDVAWASFGVVVKKGAFYSMLLVAMFYGGLIGWNIGIIFL